MTTPTDLIGDIHGHADRLKALLRKLGYERKNGAYRHPGRKVVFVGDYIDRGPDNPGVVQLVREMVDAGSAVALCGNHEFNAICFNTPKEGGGYLRQHTAKNTHQHAATLEQHRGRKGDYDSAIEWFKTLPLFLETPGLRAVHACWDGAVINRLQEVLVGANIPEDLLPEAAEKGTDLYNWVEITCKGKEAGLPEGYSFHDKDGHERREIRIKWWQNPAGQSFQDMSVLPDLGLDHLPFHNSDIGHYPSGECLVFFGHYWLKGTPELLTPNACCLDYSVAKGGVLTAYRFDGERELNGGKLVWV
ncbi:MAG: metallophosphoesterase [Phaeodactylibacter sp.]|uniref:metallophosphoesterase n=1 Tax=Phaeodactylibacter sp. TaxID=1940289 RepID=UPI0032EEE856